MEPPTGPPKPSWGLGDFEPFEDEADKIGRITRYYFTPGEIVHPNGSLNRKLAAFAEITSMHGIRHVHLAKSRRLRAAWAGVVAASVLCCLLYAYFSMSNFLGGPVHIQTSVKRDTLKFPAVTICNRNAIRKSRLHTIDTRWQELVSVCSMPLGDNMNSYSSVDLCTRFRTAAFRG